MLSYCRQLDQVVFFINLSLPVHASLRFQHTLHFPCSNQPTCDFNYDGDLLLIVEDVDVDDDDDDNDADDVVI